MQAVNKKAMSTFSFKTNIHSEEAVSKLAESLDKLKADQRIESWSVDVNSPEHLLQIETTKLSSKEVEHAVRGAGFDVDFTKAPQAR